MSFKIYTKTGDKGTTSLIGGVRVPKNHIRIESYGTIDELNSHLGVVNDTAQHEKISSWIKEIQDRLFTIGSVLATAPNKDISMKLPDVHAEDVQWLEQRIDEMNAVLPEMRSFILPGGHVAASNCHVARCVCRRAERICVAMLELQEEVPDLVIQYLNRLSDFLFVLARFIAHENGAADVPWTARV
ncbi:MAG: cob(I)yrinic acid a,c-diamide adenosyltransferase [Bacteroidota bacterium]|jgi:cob(I)alamin adenosyltransferase|nr:cob(I)yrinic acid a,c-diamide adenosyltransferase [Bacteroidota bacterium]